MKNILSETSEPINSLLGTIDDTRSNDDGSVFAFQDNAVQPIVEIDHTGTVCYINPAAIKLLPELITGQHADKNHPFFNNIYDIINELQIKDQKCLNRQISLNKSGYLQTIRYLNDKETFKIVARKLDENLTARNISRIHQSDFQNIFKSLPDAVFVVAASPDISHRQILEVNDAAAALLDYHHFELMQKSVADIFTDDIFSSSIDIQYSAVLSDTHKSDLISKSGRKIPVEISIKYIQQYEKPAAVILAHEISARDNSESSSKDNEGKYRSLFEESVDAMVITSRSGNILDANAAAYTLFNYSADESRKLNMFDLFFDPEERTKCQKELEDKGFMKDHRVNFVKNGGSPLECLVTTNCWYGPNGEIGGYRCIIRDLTEYIVLTKKYEESNVMLSKALDGAVQALSTMSEVRDPYTAGHQKRVAQLAAQIAIELGLSPNQVKSVHFAGLMHDIGKISIPAELLSKPNALAEIEKIFIQNHPVISYEILKSIQFPWPICEIVIQHHERLDGSGYPKHLRGEEINMEARIIAVADVVEAMSSHRPYRPSLGITKALEEIATNSGTLYDSKVVKACIKLFKENNFQFSA